MIALSCQSLSHSTSTYLCIHNNAFQPKPDIFYRTQVRSLPCLVSHWVTQRQRISVSTTMPFNPSLISCQSLSHSTSTYLCIHNNAFQPKPDIFLSDPSQIIALSCQSMSHSLLLVNFEVWTIVRWISLKVVTCTYVYIIHVCMHLSKLIRKIDKWIFLIFHMNLSNLGLLCLWQCFHFQSEGGKGCCFWAAPPSELFSWKMRPFSIYFWVCFLY